MQQRQFDLESQNKDNCCNLCIIVGGNNTCLWANNIFQDKDLRVGNTLECLFISLHIRLFQLVDVFCYSSKYFIRLHMNT